MTVIFAPQKSQPPTLPRASEQRSARPNTCEVSNKSPGVGSTVTRPFDRGAPYLRARLSTDVPSATPARAIFIGHPLPLPGTKDAPLFDGRHASIFVETIELLVQASGSSHAPQARYHRPLEDSRRTH